MQWSTMGGAVHQGVLLLCEAVHQVPERDEETYNAACGEREHGARGRGARLRVRGARAQGLAPPLDAHFARVVLEEEGEKENYSEADEAGAVEDGAEALDEAGADDGREGGEDAEGEAVAAVLFIVGHVPAVEGAHEVAAEGDGAQRVRAEHVDAGEEEDGVDHRLRAPRLPDVVLIHSGEQRASSGGSGGGSGGSVSRRDASVGAHVAVPVEVALLHHAAAHVYGDGEADGNVK